MDMNAERKKVWKNTKNQRKRSLRASKIYFIKIKFCGISSALTKNPKNKKIEHPNIMLGRSDQI